MDLFWKPKAGQPFKKDPAEQKNLGRNLGANFIRIRNTATIRKSRILLMSLPCSSKKPNYIFHSAILKYCNQPKLRNQSKPMAKKSLDLSYAIHHSVWKWQNAIYCRVLFLKSLEFWIWIWNKYRRNRCTTELSCYGKWGLGSYPSAASYCLPFSNQHKNHVAQIPEIW